MGLLVGMALAAESGADELREQALRAGCNQMVVALAASHPRPEDLLPDEMYIGGSQPAEIQNFTEVFFRVLDAQRAFARQEGRLRERTQHIKTIYSGMVAEVKIAPDIPDNLRHGFFSAPAGSAFTALARYSSGMGVRKPDIFPDVTGFSLKILRPSEDNPRIEDWNLTFTKSVSAFAQDPFGFLQLLEFQAEPRLLPKIWKGFKWAYDQPRAAYRLLTSAGRPFGSVLTQTYGSGHAYAVGRQAVRFTVGPTPDTLQRLQLRHGLKHFAGIFHEALFDRDYLSRDLMGWNMQGTTTLTLYAQLPPTTGTKLDAVDLIENGLAPWNSPLIPVAEIRLLQGGGAPQEVKKLTEKVSWNPGNYFLAPRPAGRMGRGRVFAYSASQLGRWFDGVLQEPDGFDPSNGSDFQKAYTEVIQQRLRIKTFLNE